MRSDPVRIARAAKVRTILTPAPVREVPEELLRLTDVCVLNETEADSLAGTTDGPETAAEAIRSEWGLGERSIPNLIHLLEAHGVRVA